MEGRSFSGFYRNTSEEMFIKTMMEGGIGMQAPNMEMLGFKNLTQNFRTDSEELFKSWLTNGETNGSHQTGTGLRPRQASRRISAELGGLANRTGAMTENKQNNDNLFPPPTYVADESSNDLNSDMTGVEKATNLFLAKAWFQSSQPMTRSRSSELRRKYVAMQNSQTPMGIETTDFISENGVNNVPPICENQYNAFMSPSNSSSSNFNNQQAGNEDKISSVVSMLKGTLERKKLTNNNNNQVGNNEVVDSSFEYFNQEAQLGPSVYENYAGVLQTIEESLLEGIAGPTISREPSQSESSTAPQLVSNCFDDPCASLQAPTACESSWNQMGDAKDSRERIYENTKVEQKKKRSLIRYGSVTSSGSAERGDPTKKRRVERSRKMAEAKERSSTPIIPSDMQSILKRCENLEKEVRSLKLNLSFMNRKDSEQTKQIEELQKHNDELSDEKNRLLEEIERIIAETPHV